MVNGYIIGTNIIRHEITLLRLSTECYIHHVENGLLGPTMAYYDLHVVGVRLLDGNWNGIGSTPGFTLIRDQAILLSGAWCTQNGVAEILLRLWNAPHIIIFIPRTS